MHVMFSHIFSRALSCSSSRYSAPMPRQYSSSRLHLHVVQLCLAWLVCALAAAPVFAQTPANSAAKPSAEKNANNQEWIVLARRASADQAQGKLQEALQGFTKSLALQPSNPGLWLARSQVLFELRNFQGTVDDATEGLRLNMPVNLRSKFFGTRASALMNMQRFEDARKDFDAAIKLEPKLDLLYLNRGILEGALTRYSQAIADHSMALKLTKAGSQVAGRAYYERGNGRMQLGDFRNALADYSEAAAITPNALEVFLNRGNVNGQLGLQKEAEADFTKVIGLDPRNLLAYSSRTIVRTTLGDYTGALRDCDSVIALDPRNSNVYANRATIKKLQQDYRGAIDDLTQVLKKNPQDVDAFTNSTSLIQSRNNELKFNNALAFLNRGSLRMLLADSAGAMADWTKAIETGSGDAVDVVVKFHNKVKKAFEPNPKFPATYQLVPRNERDSGVIDLSGTVFRPTTATRLDSVYAVITRNGKPWRHLSVSVDYAEKMMVRQIGFTLTTSIPAGLDNFGITLRLKNTIGTLDTVLARADSVVCGDAILVTGQSNATLGSTWDFPQRSAVRTCKIGHSDNYWALANAANEDGMGGVGALGLRIAERIVSEQRVAVCVINGAVSAATIEQHLPTPKRRTDAQTLYGRMLVRADKAGVTSAVKALVWYQGESNTAENYLARFTELHKAWHEDYRALQAVYVVQIHPSICSQLDQAAMRDLQRRLPATFADVRVLASAGLGVLSDECHFTDEGYKQLGDALARLVQRDFYRSSDTVGIASPALTRAYFTNKEKTEIALEFSPNSGDIVATPDLDAAGAKRTIAEAFLFGGAMNVEMSMLQGSGANAGAQSSASAKAILSNSLPVASVRTQGSTVFLTLREAPKRSSGGDKADKSDKANPITLSYVPNAFYPASTKAYAGPWLVTKRGVGVLAFDNVVVEESQR
jgi:tetratricopeptide (TPR) repeat protein